MKRGPDKKFFPNMLQGVGGYIEKGETIEHAAIREVKEEADLDVIKITFIGE